MDICWSGSSAVVDVSSTFSAFPERISFHFLYSLLLADAYESGGTFHFTNFGVRWNNARAAHGLRGAHCPSCNQIHCCELSARFFDILHDSGISSSSDHTVLFNMSFK